MSKEAATGKDAASLLSAWEAEHKNWLGGIVLDAAIWNDDHSAAIAMDLVILRRHILTMLTRVTQETA